MKLSRIYSPILFRRYLKISGILCLFLLSAWGVGFDGARLWHGFPAMADLLRRIFYPHFAYFSKVLASLGETLEIAVLATILGVFFSLIPAVLMSRKLFSVSWIPVTISGFFAFLRTIPSLIWAAFLVTMFSVGKFSGILATVIMAILIASRLFREHIDNISEEQILSMKMTGAGRFQILKYGIFPNIQPHLISVFFLVLESCVRSAAILGFVGAGGIGQMLWQDLNTFRYDKVATIILVLFLFIYGMDAVSYRLRLYLENPSSVFTISEWKTYRLKQKIGIFGLVLAAILLFFVNFKITPERWRIGLKQGGYILKQLISIDFSYSYKLWEGLLESMVIAVFATLLGGIIAYLFSGFAARNISGKISAYFWKAVSNLCRTFPPVILAIIFFRGVGPGAFAGSMALSIYTAGVMMKVYVETLEAFPQEKLHSLRMTGAGTARIYRYGIFPETAVSFYNFLLYRMESNIRNSTILGIVGAGGIGSVLSANIQWRNWNRVGLLLLGCGLMIIMVDRLSQFLRTKMTE